MTGTSDDAAPGADDAVTRQRWGVKDWLGITGMVLAIGAAWWFTAVHPGGQLGPPTSGGLCVTRDGQTEDDLAVGAALRPMSDVELTGVALVEAQNVEVVDAVVVPVAASPDGSTTLVGATTWPLTSSDRVRLTLDWDGEQALEGARLTAGTAQNLILHVHASDPAAKASWSAFRVSFHTAGARWAETFELTLVVPPGDAACPDAG